MEPQVWQEVQEEAGAAAPVAVVAAAGAPATPLPVCGVPMKGVILANRKTIFHKTRICPRLSLGSCHLGTACPAEAKGETCRFAHSKGEIRHTANMFKTNMCLKWIRGKCKKEAQCNHAHGHQELKHYRSLAMASGTRDFARESEATMSRRRKQGNAAGAVAAAAGGSAAGGSRGLPGWKESGGGNSRGHGYHRSSRSSRQQHAKNSNDGGSVNAVLAALYEELLKGTGRREGSYSSSGGLSTYQDDSTTATDELSDFSSFSSRGLSDPLCPAASTSTTSSFGGSLHASGASDVFQTTPSCLGTPTTTSLSSSSSDLKLDVNRLLLLRAIAGDSGSLLMGACDQQEDAMNQSPTTTAASLTSEGDSMTQLEVNLARLCLADVPARPHYYTEPPPGFEHLQQRRQQQHAVVDLERLATVDGLN